MAQAPEQPMEAAPEIAQDQPGLTPLEVLAELELLRRKTELMERRIVAWEQVVETLRRDLAQVEQKARGGAPASPDELDDLRHRLERLERRRLAAAETFGGQAPAVIRPLSARGDEADVVALVRARWVPSNPVAGEDAELTARCDGIPAGQKVGVRVRSLTSEQPIAELEGVSDGDRVVAKWKIPADCPHSEILFEVYSGRAMARSPVLSLPGAQER